MYSRSNYKTNSIQISNKTLIHIYKQNSSYIFKYNPHKYTYTNTKNIILAYIYRYAYLYV